MDFTNRKPGNINNRNFPNQMVEENQDVSQTSGVQHHVSHKQSVQQSKIQQKIIEQQGGQGVKPFIQKLKLTMDDSMLNNQQQQNWDQSMDYVEHHSDYHNGPLSPNSKKALGFGLEYATNKNPNNLESKPGSENMSVGKFPHFNDDNGQSSPRGETFIELNQAFQNHYDSQLSAPQRKLTNSFANWNQDRQDYEQSNSSFDSREMARFQRAKY